MISMDQNLADAFPDSGAIAALGAESLGRLLERHRGRLRKLVALRLDPRLHGRVDPSDVIQDAYLDAAALSIQAMALARLGRADEAERRLCQTKGHLAKQPQTGAAKMWAYRLIAGRLAREADAVVRLDPIFPADPFAR
jgi:hypothetical protein